MVKPRFSSFLCNLSVINRWSLVATPTVGLFLILDPALATSIQHFNTPNPDLEVGWFSQKDVTSTTSLHPPLSLAVDDRPTPAIDGAKPTIVATNPGVPPPAQPSPASPANSPAASCGSQRSCSQAPYLLAQLPVPYPPPVPSQQGTPPPPIYSPATPFPPQGYGAPYPANVAAPPSNGTASTPYPYGAPVVLILYPSYPPGRVPPGSGGSQSQLAPLPYPPTMYGAGSAYTIPPNLVSYPPGQTPNFAMPGYSPYPTGAAGTPYAAPLPPLPIPANTAYPYGGASYGMVPGGIPYAASGGYPGNPNPYAVPQGGMQPPIYYLDPYPQPAYGGQPPGYGLPQNAPGVLVPGYPPPSQGYVPYMYGGPSPGSTALPPGGNFVGPEARNLPVQPIVPGIPVQVPPPSISPPPPATPNRPLRSTAFNDPRLQFQGVYIYQGEEGSGRARVTGVYPLTPQFLVGGTIDVVDGNAFTDSRREGINVNELYVAATIPELPNFRIVAGQLDLTSYFDRNSFAKDAATMFFNSTFQTNPALAATGIGSRQAALVNWSITDNAEAKVAIFSSSRELNDFSLDGFAGELGIRFGNFILRGTYATNRDAGNDDGFREIFQIDRGNGRTGLLEGDREEAFGVNAEVYIPQIRMGIFGRYGQYYNWEVDRSANTFSAGVTFLDLLTPSDRLGIAYGRGLSNETLRQRSDDQVLDVLEIFYSFAVLPNLSLGLTFQALDGLSESILGIRVKTDFNLVAPQRAP